MHLENGDLVHPKGGGTPRKVGYSFQYDSKHPIVMHFVHFNCLGGSLSGGVELKEPGRLLFCSLLKELAIIDAF